LNKSKKDASQKKGAQKPYGDCPMQIVLVHHDK